MSSCFNNTGRAAEKIVVVSFPFLLDIYHTWIYDLLHRGSERTEILFMLYVKHI